MNSTISWYIFISHQALLLLQQKSDKHWPYRLYDGPKSMEGDTLYLYNGLVPQPKYWEGWVQYLKNHPEKQKEFELFQNTKLAPDKSDVFRNKSNV